LLGLVVHCQKRIDLLFVEFVFYGFCDFDECVVDVEVGLGGRFDILDAVRFSKFFAIKLAYSPLYSVVEVALVRYQIDFDFGVCVLRNRLHPRSYVVEGLLAFHVVNQQDAVHAAIIIFYYGKILACAGSVPYLWKMKNFKRSTNQNDPERPKDFQNSNSSIT
jgi:hypothetical protein